MAGRPVHKGVGGKSRDTDRTSKVSHILGIVPGAPSKADYTPRGTRRPYTETATAMANVRRRDREAARRAKG